MTKARTFLETGIWKYTVNTAIVLLAATTLTLASADQSMAGVTLPIWLEDPHETDRDAGGRGNEQLLTGPIGLEYGGISGDLGFNQIMGFLDTQLVEEMEYPVMRDDYIDVFGFYHAGGEFLAFMSFPDLFTIALFDTDYSFPPLLVSTGFGNTTIGTKDLAAGNYFLELTTGAIDPPFNIATTPIQAFRVAEPAMIAVFAIGLAAMGGLARRRQNRKS